MFNFTLDFNQIKGLSGLVDYIQPFINQVIAQAQQQQPNLQSLPQWLDQLQITTIPPQTLTWDQVDLNLSVEQVAQIMTQDQKQQQLYHLFHNPQNWLKQMLFLKLAQNDLNHELAPYCRQLSPQELQKKVSLLIQRSFLTVKKQQQETKAPFDYQLLVELLQRQITAIEMLATGNDKK